MRFSIATRSLATLAARILAAAILVSPLAAQIRGAASGAMGVGISARPAPGFVGSGAAGGSAHLHRGRPSGRGSLLLPYPYFYSTYANETEEAAPPPVVVVPATAPAPALPDLPREPLLIEWQGDHFERMTPFQKALASGPSAPDSSKSDVRSSALAPSAPSSSAPGSSPRSSFARRSPAPPGKVSAQPQRELPPAVLVFRDGRTEQVSSYIIASGIIYSKADYWTSGTWTREIQIADLDVPATLRINHQHGLTFVLPTGPNEVVTRP